MKFNFDTENVYNLALSYGVKIIAALAIWIIGMWVIKLLMKGITRQLEKNKKIDKTLSTFLCNLIRAALIVLLVISILGQLGIDTASFAAILAAAGLAIGLALQGSLANFAGGFLIILFKPFKAGDLIEVQGELGVVEDIQIFTTTLTSPTNKEIIIPNGPLSNGNIINYTKRGTLRVDHVIGVSYDADIKKTKEILLKVLTDQDNVLATPAPSVTVTALNDSSVDFAVRPWANVDNYWEVYFNTLENAKIALDKAGIEIPYPHTVEIKKEA